MKYLVLGSSGQVGSHLSEYLQKRGDHVAVPFDIVRDPSEDLRYNLPLLVERMRDVDFVFFLAFDVGGARYLQQYQHTFEFIDNNIKLMQHGFDALRALRKPFIFASSQMSNMVQSPYGILKAVGEDYTRALNGIIVKFWNVYGVERDPKKFHVITDFIKKARTNGKIEMLSSGAEERQFLYADDCCACLHKLSAAYDSIARDQNLHITSFHWTKILEIAEIIGRQMKVPVVPGPSAVDATQGFKKNEPDRSILQFWQPTTSVEDGIARVIAAID
jgi:nucleoside-diphosphate-sugar epimerase